MKRVWTEAELDVIDDTPRMQAASPLTREQIVAIRRRADSLTEPWSIRDLAREYGVGWETISQIVNRRRFRDHAYEPTKWWRKRG